MPVVFPAVYGQTYKDFDFHVVISGNDDKGKEWIAENYPQAKIHDPGYNIGFSKGHNELFSELDSDLFQLINPDLVLTPNYLELMIKTFEDRNIGAGTGKILQFDFKKNQPTDRIDTTGVIIARSGRGRDRGQHEVDKGQYDTKTDLIAVSGASAMYRRSALEDVKYKREDGRVEYYDEDMHSYWEDVDLSWRMAGRGWKIVYNPSAVAYHGRAASSSPGGYRKVWSFIKHHRQIPERILQLNYRNHIFLYIKNSPKLYWQFFAREFFYHCFMLFWETKTLKALPGLVKILPVMWRKRKHISQERKISDIEGEKLLR